MAPKALVHRRAGRHLERHAHPIDIQYIPVRSQHLVHKPDSRAILHLVIHVEHPQLPPRAMLPHILDAHIKQRAAVLSPRERHIHIVKSIEYLLQPHQRLLINVQPFWSGSRYSIFTYCFHFFVTSKLSPLKTSSSRVNTTACNLCSAPRQPAAAATKAESTPVSSPAT